MVCDWTITICLAEFVWILFTDDSDEFKRFLRLSLKSINEQSSLLIESGLSRNNAHSGGEVKSCASDPHFYMYCINYLINLWQGISQKLYHFFFLSFGAIVNGSFSFSFKLTPFKLKSSKLSADDVWSLGAENAVGFKLAVKFLPGGRASIRVFSLFLILLKPTIPSSMLLEFWSKGLTLFFLNSSS